MDELVEACEHGNVDVIREIHRKQPTLFLRGLDYRLTRAASSQHDPQQRSVLLLAVLRQEFGCRFQPDLLHSVVENGDMDTLCHILNNSDEYDWYESAHEDIKPGRRGPDRRGTALMHAVRCQVDLSFIKVLVEEALIPVDACFDNEESSALSMARRDDDVVDYLQAIAELTDACRSGDHPKMERLLQRGKVHPGSVCLVNHGKQYHRHLVHVAFEKGDQVAARILLNHGATLNATDLHAAIDEDQQGQDFLRWLCQQPVIDIHARCNNTTPLERAVITDMHIAAEVFLEEGADIETSCPSSGDLHSSLLFRACDRGNVEMTRLLLRYGANRTQQQSASGWSALHQAITRVDGRTDLVEAIVMTHRNPNHNDDDDADDLRNVLWGCNRLGDEKWKSPLVYAADLGYLDIVELLIVPRIVELRHG